MTLSKTKHDHYAECRYAECAECHYAECRYAKCAECHYAECRYAECRGATADTPNN